MIQPEAQPIELMLKSEGFNVYSTGVRGAAECFAATDKSVYG
jgi:hypothetical protein